MYVPVNANVAERFLNGVRHEERFGKRFLGPGDNPFTVAESGKRSGLYAWKEPFHAIHAARLHGWSLFTTPLTLIKVSLPATTYDALLGSGSLFVLREDVVWQFCPFDLFALESTKVEFSIAEREIAAVRREHASSGITW